MVCSEAINSEQLFSIETLTKLTVPVTSHVTMEKTWDNSIKLGKVGCVTLKEIHWESRGNSHTFCHKLIHGSGV